MIQFKIDDAGKSLSQRPKNASDCFVRAICIAHGHTSYDEAYDACSSFGRESSQRTSWNTVAQVLAKISAQETRITKHGMNLDTFAKMFPQGRYVLCIDGHALACIDGIYHDKVCPSPTATLIRADRIVDNPPELMDSI